MAKISSVLGACGFTVIEATSGIGKGRFFTVISACFKRPGLPSSLSATTPKRLVPTLTNRASYFHSVPDPVMGCLLPSISTKTFSAGADVFATILTGSSAKGICGVTSIEPTSARGEGRLSTSSSPVLTIPRTPSEFLAATVKLVLPRCSSFFS
jgi:hypothetical protein